MDIRRAVVIVPFALACAVSLGCESGLEDAATPAGTSEAAPQLTTPLTVALPPTEATAQARLNHSPRHGEWVAIPLPGSNVPVSTWVMYPERAGPAPVVLVIHEIFGLTDWVRGVADQFATEGFIAVAPDLLSGMGPNDGGTASLGERDNVVATIRILEPDERARRLDAVRAYALEMPAASGRIGSVGFCWGGTSSFAYVASQPQLDAAVVYYGTSPETPDEFARITAPVLGHYGEDDERVNATIPRAEAGMAGGPAFEPHIYPGAGHGFLRAQDARAGANLRAAEQAWPLTLAFFREHLEE